MRADATITGFAGLVVAALANPLSTLTGLSPTTEYFIGTAFVVYGLAFAHPARKIFYNLTITGLSVAVALLIGTIELVGVLHDNLNWINPVTTWVSGLNLNNVGFVIVAMFVATWACAIAYWRLSGAEKRWQTAQPSGTAE